VQPSMELSRHVDGSPYGFSFHKGIIRRPT
jgi:hypothetical protein